MAQFLQKRDAQLTCVKVELGFCNFLSFLFSSYERMDVAMNKPTKYVF